MTPPPAPWTIVYADGSANLYRFEAEPKRVRFSYEPVSPAESSTGMYSGGTPIDQILAADDPRLATLWEHTQALEADTRRHVDERQKGDGAFTVTSGGNRRRFLVTRAATRKLEDFLERDFRGLAEE
jgi:hypothetical protein